MVALVLCACGCGRPTEKPTHRWLRNHTPAAKARKLRYAQKDPALMNARAKAWRDDPANRETYLASKRRNQAKRWHRQRAGSTDVDSAYEYMQVLLGDPCSYCGSRAEVADHIVPVADGGGSDWDNLTAACAWCNGSKHSRSLLTFLAA
jgi:5-methylcytosine-specific restriction endonuclease McrA